jgi:hypothetical protein
MAMAFSFLERMRTLPVIYQRSDAYLSQPIEHIPFNRIDLFFQNTSSPVGAYFFLKNTLVQLDRILKDPYQIREQDVLSWIGQGEPASLPLGGVKEAFTTQGLQDLP